MLFRLSFYLLEIQTIIAWLVLLFQIVIFFAENSVHHKQSRRGARTGAFLFESWPAL
jgi:hypothetical protein